MVHRKAAAKARIQNLQSSRNKRRKIGGSDQECCFPNQDIASPASAVEIPSDSDSDASSDSEIVELSALDLFCNIFKKAQELAIQDQNESMRPKTYTGRSKRTLARRRQEQRIARANGSQFITDFFQSTRESPAQVPVPAIRLEDEESANSSGEGVEDLEDPEEHLPMLPIAASLHTLISEASHQGWIPDKGGVTIDQGDSITTEGMLCAEVEEGSSAEENEGQTFEHAPANLETPEQTFKVAVYLTPRSW
ncbi:hypothetical protein EDB85DRAFT_1898840 [Lactarius pseudohatsudake]|nr:hypothetical protein EDB85DRAFT_1898840 [Lactarius pseudohatsudake]